MGHARSLTIASAEGECECFNARIEKLDLETPFGRAVTLPHELVQTVLANDALPVRARVTAVVRRRRVAVESHAEADRPAVRCRPEHEVQVAREKAIDDAPARGDETHRLRALDPIAVQPPLV